MPETPFIWSSLAPVTPEICLVVAICAILLIDVFAGERRAGLTSTLTLLALALSAALTVEYAHVNERVVILQGMYVADELAFVLKLAGFLVVAIRPPTLVVCCLPAARVSCCRSPCGEAGRCRSCYR